MKRIVKKWNPLLVVLLISVSFMFSCSKTEADQDQGITEVKNQEVLFSPLVISGVSTEYLFLNPSNCIDSFPYEELSDGEVEAIMLMREEELMAKDVYTFLYPIWNIPIFDNISRSENQHTIMVGLLIAKYELPDPGAGHVPGVFQNQDLQELYDVLTVQGSNSLIEGLTVGATIEDVDIFDLQELLENVIDNEDITWVFENLSRGSRNHMRSFYGNLVFRGADYEPQYITPEYFEEIINSPHEIGNGGCGCENTM